MPKRTQPVRPIGVADRGVYEHPFIGPEGERYLFAVDHRGRRIMEATVYPWTSDPSVVTDFLEAFLDREDPAHIKLLP